MDNQTRLRIAKVKANAKLKLLLLLSISEPQHKPETSKKVQVQDMPVNSIYTDEKRFQNRANAFSSESANRIIKAVENNTFDWSKFDPIIIWFDDKAGKYFVLSGHSRLAAFKELSKTNNEFKNIPVKIFSGSQMQAIDLALNSNTLSTKETEVERAMYYNRKRQTCEISRSIGLLGALTECEKLVETNCRDNEGKNANYILNLSYLNPDGFLMDSLNKLGVERDNESTNTLRTIANWIGEARRNNKELLNVQETEIAKYLLNGGYGNKAGQFKNKAMFNERLKYSFDKWKAAGADPNRPLNLANTLSKSSFEQDFDNRLAKAKADLDQALNEHQEKHTKYLLARMNGQITEKRFNELMAPLIQNVDWHKKEYDRIRGQKDDVKKAASAQTSLWGIAKAKAAAKLKLLQLVSLEGIESIDFNKQILLYKAGKLPIDYLLVLGYPGQKLLNCGVKNKEIKLKQTVINKALTKHNLLIDSFINLPEKINNPNSIIQSEVFKTSKIILIDMIDIKNHPVIVVIATDKNNQINDISSIYGKYRRQLKNWVNKGLVLYKRKNFDF